MADRDNHWTRKTRGVRRENRVQVSAPSRLCQVKYCPNYWNSSSALGFVALLHEPDAIIAILTLTTTCMRCLPLIMQTWHLVVMNKQDAMRTSLLKKWGFLIRLAITN